MPPPQAPNSHCDPDPRPNALSRASPDGTSMPGGRPRLSVIVWFGSRSTNYLGSGAGSQPTAVICPPNFSRSNGDTEHFEQVFKKGDRPKQESVSRLATRDTGC